MKRKVAVEGSLRNVMDYLSEQGYEVRVFEENRYNLDGYDAVVISGQDDNVMGITTTTTKIPVIDATGKSPVQVYNQLRETLR